LNARPRWWLIVLVAAFTYPSAVVVGGAPRFPSRADCVHPAKTDGDLEAVFGRFRSETRAVPILRRALRVGFKGTEIESDGCGFLKVTLHEIPTLEVGHAFVAQARRVGFNPKLEQASP
jgi:hypothetical protein